MSDHLLVQYREESCVFDGYPFPWAHESLGLAPYEGAPVQDYPKYPPIKDYIRELAGDRCVRCGHPYVKGEHPLENGESWSLCDAQCTHPGPYKTAAPDGIPSTYQPSGPGELQELIREGWFVWALWRVLTVHHLDEDKANCRWWNLAALCQRCHLRMQRAVVMGRPYHFEHSEWFKPYAAGFYAWKYLGEDLGREDTLQRLSELLALEHRFTQEALI